MEEAPFCFSLFSDFSFPSYGTLNTEKRGTAVSCALAQLFIFIIDIHVYCTCTIFI